MNIKRILNLAWNEFIYGGHLLSLGAVSVVFTSAVLLNIKTTWDCLAIVYLGTQSVYLYNRYKEFKKDTSTNPKRTKYIKRYVKYIPLIVFSFSFTTIAIVVLFNKFLVFTFGLFLLLIGIFYSESLKRFTKKIIAFKNFIVSLIWASLVIFLALYYASSWNLALILIITFVFLRLFLNTIFFDIKDIKSDKAEGLLTLPIVYEKTKLKLMYYLYLINILSAFPIIIGIVFKRLPQFSIGLLLTIPYSFYYLRKINETNVNFNFISYVFVDGEYLLWPILILFTKSFL